MELNELEKGLTTLDKEARKQEPPVHRDTSTLEILQFRHNLLLQDRKAVVSFFATLLFAVVSL